MAIALARGSAGPLEVDPAYARWLQSQGVQRALTAAADLDGDGREDVVEWLGSSGTTLQVHRNLGGSRFAPIVVPTDTPNARDLVLADVDGDGDRDLVLSGGFSPPMLQVLRNDGSGGFTAMPTIALPARVTLEAGDLDADGDAEIVVTDGATARLFDDVGGAVLQPGATLAAGAAGTCGIADFDRDGDLDVLVPAGAACADLLQNDGSGAFPTRVACALPLTFAPEHFVCADADGDGDPDVVAGAATEVVLFLNGPGNVFTPAVGLPVFQGGGAVRFAGPTFADLDGDGDADLLVRGGSVFLGLNDGTGRFTDVASGRWNVRPMGAVPVELAAVHLDEDGDLDFYGTDISLPALANNQRTLLSLEPPLPGGRLRLRATHEAGFASPGGVFLGFLATALRAAPLRVPGIAGVLAISPAAAGPLPILPLPAPAGGAEIAIAIPPAPSLVGLDVFVQGLFAGTSGQAPGFSALVVERILWQ